MWVELVKFLSAGLMRVSEVSVQETFKKNRKTRKGDNSSFDTLSPPSSGKERKQS